MSIGKTYTLNNWKECIWDFFEPVRDFISKEKFYIPNLRSYEEQINNKHGNWVEQNRTIIAELNILVEEHPRKALEIIRTSLLNIEEMNSFFRLQIFSQRELPSPGEQIRQLAGSYEHLNQLKFISYLLSRRRADFDTLVRQEQILKHLKALGLSSTEITLFRSLRNAHNHKIILRNGKCVLEGEREISVDTIGEIYNKIKSYFDYMRDILLCSVLNIPRLTLYIGIIFYNNRDELDTKYKDLGECFKLFYPELIKGRVPYDVAPKNKGIFSHFLSKIFPKKKKVEVPPVLVHRRIIDLCRFVAQSKVELYRLLSTLSEHEDGDEYCIYIRKVDSALDPIFESIKKEVLKSKQ